MAPDAPKTPWKGVGPADAYLHQALLDMYWDGVKRELAHILMTLKRWQQPEYTETVLPDEEDDFIHGYDTFLDQVSETSWDFAHRHNEKLHDKKEDPPPSYEEALRDRARDLLADYKSSSLKSGIRAALTERRPISTLRRRARMLLQAGGFLDIDKVIEYREPEVLSSFWKRAAVPQLCFRGLDMACMPVIAPQLCTRCHAVICGSSFRSDTAHGNIVICESCYTRHHYAQPQLLKSYKQSVLSQSITPQISRQICRCSTVQRIDGDGRSRALFPVDKGDAHRGAELPPASLHCGLLDLGELVAEARYQATLSKLEKRTKLSEIKRVDEARKEERIQELKKKSRKAKKSGKAQMVQGRSSLLDPSVRTAEFGKSAGITDGEDSDIPFFLRSTADKYPYGNVHMALRIGPVLIENGGKYTHGGALITSRDPPNLQVLRDSGEDIKHSLLVAGITNRTLYSQQREREPKRYKTIMKQVVGGAFSCFFKEKLEDEIIDALIEASHQIVDPGLGAAVAAAILEECLQILMAKLKEYLGPRISLYLASLAKRLVDVAVPLRWDFHTNNCQNFCDNLLDKELFLPLVAPTDISIFDEDKQATILGPLYLISFVCRPGAYSKAIPRSKFDVPNGLTEEYLLKFRYGRHDESDMLDTLMEYWYDWGGFGGPLYPYQDVFPWDCTEAYGRYPTQCGDCNLAKHVLAFPFDSWSVISLHLARGRHLYPPEPGQAQHLSGLPWMRNRLVVLLAQDILLAAAVAMAKSRSFRERTAWLHRPRHPDAAPPSQQQPPPPPPADLSQPNGITLAVCLQYPASRGSVHITSSDPTTQPAIDPAYLKHPADVAVLAAGGLWVWGNGAWLCGRLCDCMWRQVWEWVS
ncbi:hypothetical protein EPUS_06972 [Endocarpon pusillum Z07020]|uniref:Glucose-methanol-choline oxidoreductase C-terminal domain-containing protein n=1 Tax=Endocarpon pusillum (strain Z07020 / HMAS-L-300199) TaxID=1263415 RepID=U1I325_ENDPU|nr:uncharacterized protein EPUS_06972 [Endocarpon pusillum Z07020]ERF76414.1 hypothetical protein EPUS_06972 [Endocarpon pusillum Z07020]